jgi:hypothetical protein
MGDVFRNQSAGTIRHSDLFFLARQLFYRVNMDTPGTIGRDEISGSFCY